MTVKIKLYSDFVCPYCVITKKPLFDAAAGKDVEFEWMPFELSPVGVPSDSTKSNHIHGGWDSNVAPLAKRHGVTLTMPWHIDPIPKTFLAHEGYQFAKLAKKEWAYIGAVNDAYWIDGLDISQPDVLVNAAGKVGLDREAFAEALTNRTFQKTQEKLLHHAIVETNIQSVPTVFIGDKRVIGLQTQEVYGQLITNELATALDGLQCSDDHCDIPTK